MSATSMEWIVYCSEMLGQCRVRESEGDKKVIIPVKDLKIILERIVRLEQNNVAN